MDNDGATRRRGSVLRVSRLLERGKDKYKTRRSVDIEHERLREAAERSAGLHSIIPELDDHDVQRSSDDFRQAARDEAAAKLCGIAIAPDPPPPLPLVPIFPCALSSLSAHTQLSGPLLKHQTPNALARLVGSKAWKSRHAVFCTYALRNCSCAPHRTSGPPCDSATRTLACLHVFATPTPDALELARLIVTEDSVVFVVEPTLAPDDSRRGPRDLDGRKCVFQVQGINGAPPTQPPNERISRRPLSRRRESVGNGAPSFKSGMTGRPKTSLGLAPNSSSANLGIGLDDDARVHAVWFLQCPDADARQRWVSCIKRAVLLQRAERAGFGGTVHFTSPRSVTDPLPVPSGDLDVVLAMRAQAHRGSTGPSQTHYASPPVTPMTSSFSPIQPQFVPITPGSSSFATSPTGFTPSSATFSPISPGSDNSHYVDAISLAFTRSQTPTYSPSVHTTHTAPALIPQSKSRNRSATVTNSAPVQALRGFFSGVSRPPSRSASVAVGKEGKDAREKRMRAASSATTAANPGHVHHNSYGGSKSEDAGEPVQCTHPYYQSLMHPLGTPISAGLGSMDLSSNERSEEGLGMSGTPGMGTSALPGLGPNGLPTPGLAGLSILHAPSPTKPSNGVGVGKLGTSLPPPPRARRAGSVSHVLPGLASALAQHGKDDAMGRVQEEAMGRIAREGSGTVRGRSEDGRPSLVPMLSLSFGRGEEQDGESGKENNPPGGRVLPPKLAPPSAPLPTPPGAPVGSRSSLALPTMGSAFNGLSVTTSPVLPGAWPSPMAHPMSDGPMSAVTASDAYLTAPHDTPTVSPQSPTSHSTPSAYSVPTVPSDALGGASYINLSAHPDSTFDTSHLDLSETTPQPGSTPFTSDGPSASDSSQASVYSVQTTSTRGKFLGGLDALHESDVFRGPDVSRSSYRLGSRTSLDDTTHSRVSLALARGVLHEYPEGDEWDGDSVGRDYAHSGSGREYSQSISVRESPTRTGSYRASSPIAFMRDSSGPAERPWDRTGHFPRESFGSAFLDGEDVPAFSHPFSSASQSPSPSRRGHRRAGSYGGPTLFTISGSPLRRSRSQRSKPEKLPPAAPPPSFPLPPTPMGSRPTTPVSRPRTPVSRPRTPVSRPRTPGSIPPVPALPPPPRHTSLRTRLRILSTSSTPEPQPPRELPPPPTEDELAQPISRVPIQLLVREDSTARRGSASKESYVGTSLPPPPRARPIRTQSYSDPEGRRSDSSVGEQY